MRGSWVVSTISFLAPFSLEAYCPRGSGPCKTAWECASGYSSLLKQNWESLWLIYCLRYGYFPQPGNSCLFPHSFAPLKSLTTKSCSSAQASMEARLRSQNGLSLQWLLLSQESHAWFSFLGTPALPAYNPDWLTSCLFPCGYVHVTEGMRYTLASHTPSLNRKHRTLMTLMWHLPCFFLLQTSMSVPPCGLLQVGKLSLWNQNSWIWTSDSPLTSCVKHLAFRCLSFSDCKVGTAMTVLWLS